MLISGTKRNIRELQKYKIICRASFKVKYGFISVKKYLKKSYTEIYQLLLDLDDKITEIGFDENYDINEEGILLQRLYDDLYYQNSEI